MMRLSARRCWTLANCVFHIFAAFVFIDLAHAQQAPLHQVFANGESPQDSRLEKPRTLKDKYHPWTPPETAEEWNIESKRIRQQLLVSNGLWPLPERTPLKAVIHGRIEKKDYVIDKVFFASRPGHYVSGLLYRPKNITGKVPAVLSPHGHWQTGRFYDAGETESQKQLDQKAESLMCAARYPLQARMIQLARMGCIVFHYDMVGYADSTTLDHRTGFADAEASLRLQNMMGIQTWNSIRALDFVESLPDVDPKRIGVTGASGGGTQTFMLCAVDPRPAVAFPAVMVSTAMQGGCVCENADYLRIGINNIAIAALCAPRPMGLSGADDWSIDILTKGYPELQKVYSFFDAKDKVEARAWPEFKHNYNSVSRNFMYEWFNQHLNLGVKDLKEREFSPLTAAESSVFDTDHPRPSDSLPVEALRTRLTSEHAKWWASVVPSTAESAEQFRTTVQPAIQAMLGRIPESGSVEVETIHKNKLTDAVHIHSGVAKHGADQVPFVSAFSNDFNGTAVVWVSSKGKSCLFDQTGQQLKRDITTLVNAGMMVVSIDALMTGELKSQGTSDNGIKVDARFPGYTFGYNRPLVSNRVCDILTAVSALQDIEQVKTIHLVGTDGAGPWALLASATGMPATTATIVNCGTFQFRNLKNVSDENFLPGAIRYGDLGGIAACISPRQLVISSSLADAASIFEPTISVGKVTGKTTFVAGTLTDAEIADRLLRLAK